MGHWVWRRNCTVSEAGGNLDLAIEGVLGTRRFANEAAGSFMAPITSRRRCFAMLAEAL